jgi:hypothetical protein
MSTVLHLEAVGADTSGTNTNALKNLAA